nr:hypothetical protein [Tanacetum cinerariifolium]
ARVPTVSRLRADPEHPPSPVEIPYIPELEYPDYLEPSDDETLLEDQPIPADASPIAASLDYVADFDPEKDPEEDPEDDQADYPADGGGGDDEPSDDDDDDDTDDKDLEEEPFKEENEEEEEHLTSADSSVVPIVDLVLPAGDTEALEADEPTHEPGSPIIIPLSQTCFHRARKTVRPELPMSASMEACITRHVALPSPPLLVPSLPLPLPSPLTTSPTDTRGVNERVTELDTTVRQRTDEFEIRFKDAQDDQALLIARVNTLFRDRPDHRCIAMLMDREAMYAREACAFSMDRSSVLTT